MLTAHALALTEARSSIAALADQAQIIDVSIDYEQVLLQLDAVHGTDIPALDTTDHCADRDGLFTRATCAIEALIGHGVDELQIELILDMLEVARDKDQR